MARQTERGASGGVQPESFPETTPQRYVGSDYSFTLQAVMELQRTVGKLQEAIEGLKDKSGGVDRRLESLNKDLQEMTKEVSAARGSINTWKWVFTILIPLATAGLIIVAKHFGAY